MANVMDVEQLEAGLAPLVGLDDEYSERWWILQPGDSHFVVTGRGIES